MPYEIEWLIPNRLIISRFSGVITLADIEAWLAIQTKMVDEGTALVHHISDSLQITSIEIKLKTFQMLLKGVSKAEHFGWHVEVTINPINLMISSLVSRFAGVRVRSYASVAEAIKFLKEKDPSLDGAQISKV